MNEYAIRADHLGRTFGSFRAVDDLSFAVRRGDVFGFLGANGAGKSTTIRMLCGLLSPTSGTGVVGGFDIAREPERVRRIIGYMSQRFSLYDDLTVEQNIRFFGGVYGLRAPHLEERMRWALRMAGLNGEERRLTRTLSGGHKQRLALGCAVLHRPEILFLDEPTGGVDPVSRRNFWELINSLSAEGVTVLVTTHFLDEAEYCNDIILIDAGKLIAGGSPVGMKSKYISKPILEIPSDDPVLLLGILDKEPWVLETSVFGRKLHVMVEDEGQGKKNLGSLFRQYGLPEVAVERIVPSLEDVFLYLLRRKEAGGDA